MNVHTTALDGLTGPLVRAVERASKGGAVHLRLLSDAAVQRHTGAPPRFPLDERRYMAEALRWVASVEIVDDAPDAEDRGDDFPPVPDCPPNPPGKKVLVTGCFDLMHSGHVRFFEEAASFGALYVIVGADANIRLLKGEGRPLIGERERCYLCNAIRHVTLATVSTGTGWLDAEPEAHRLRPDIYLVNEDGDRLEKQAFCDAQGIEYVVLRRTPKQGLSPRSSTQLRGTGR